MALPNDKEQPVNIIADKVDMNYKSGVNRFQGNASATQGTTVLTGNIIVTYSDGGHVSKIVAYGTNDKQATYRTVPKRGQEEFNSKADVITYLTLPRIAELKGNADAKHGDDKFNGPNITYNSLEQVVSTATSANGQSTITLNPS